MPSELVEVEKVIRDFFNCANRTPLVRIPALHGIWTSCPATWFSIGAHFRWLKAIENAGTSLYRIPGCRKAELFDSLVSDGEKF